MGNENFIPNSIFSKDRKNKKIEKWYRKSIDVLTEKSLISVLLLSITIISWISSNFLDGPDLTSFFIGMTLGQAIGSNLQKLKNNKKICN